jgi:predicted nucleic acid-binding protein
VTLVDASVAFKWFVPEHGTAQAQELLAASADVVAPELVLAEVGNALWKAHRRGWQPADDVATAIRDLRSSFTQLLRLDPLVERASEIARKLDHPIYDCFYLACAEHVGEPLVTADQRLIGVSARSEFAPLVRPLA